jgi:hypothetical protein
VREEINDWKRQKEELKKSIIKKLETYKWQEINNK